METISSLSTTSKSGAEAEPLTLDAVVAALLATDDAAARAWVIARALVRFSSDDLLVTLKATSERYFAINAHNSLRLAEALIEAADRADRADHRPFGLMGAADAMRLLGNYQEALRLYNEAGEIFLAQGNEVGWARTRTGWIFASHYLGRGPEALQAAELAHDILVRHEEWSRAAGMDQSLAAIHFWSGHYDQALQLYDRAQQTLERLGATVETRAARAKANKANILTLLGDFRTALALHQEVRNVYIQHGETLQVTRQTWQIAEVYDSLGEYTQALLLYNEALAGFERDGHDAEAAWVALLMVDCYLSLNRNAEALDLAEETVARFVHHGTPTEAAKARFACALAHARLGNIERALALLSEAARTFSETGLATQLSLATLQRADLYLGEEDWPAALTEAERAETMFAERGLIVRQAQAKLAQARALLGLDHLDAAAELAQATLGIVHERELPWLAHECHHLLARVSLARGSLTMALRECQAAIESIEAVQSRLAVELRSNFLANKLQVYHDAIDCCLRLPTPDPGLAFAYLERAKSRALVDYLASNPEVRVHTRRAIDQELVDEVERLRAEHNWFYNRLYGHGLAQRPLEGDQIPEHDAVTLRGQIRDREKRITRLLERLALRHAEGFEGYTSQTTDWELLRPYLDRGTVLLEYYLHESGCIVFVMTEHGVRVIPLPTNLGTVCRQLHLWQLNLEATARSLAAGQSSAGLERNARGLLQALYRSLIAPVATHLAGCTRLIVVPFGPTHQAPFQAFHDGDRFLIEQMEITICPSSSLLDLCAKRPRRGGRNVLTLAYSDHGQLPYVLEEARAVTALLPGACYTEEEATRATLAAEASRHAIIHLAAHGEARIDNPAFAYLQLADGQLSPTEVFNLPLDGALVVLSACETGRAVVQGGDELIGLSRGFLYAGASTLVQSLWRVEDRSTARLMGHFYAALRAGAEKGLALRSAQLALLNGQETLPYFWAPFQLIGDRGAC